MKVAIFLAVVGAAMAGTTVNTSWGPTLNNIPVGSYDPSGRITGGSDATPGEFPWQISLQVTPAVGARYHTCGGTILDETHIVCAAHCVVGQSLSALEVVVGAQNIKDTNEASQQRLRVKRLVYHPQYNGNTINNDGSIITLSSPITFNDRVQPLRLAPQGHEPTGRVVNTGWGNANPSGGTPAIVPDALQKVELNIVDRATCRTRYAGINTVTDSMVCAGNGALKGSCNGDSGGPLVAYDLETPYLAGIVSWGMQPCGQERYPTVFGNVAFLRPFLDAEGARP
jgi:secreted trypsin-like serine protease